MDMLQIQYKKLVSVITFGLTFFVATYIGSFVLMKKIRNRSSKNSMLRLLSDGDIARICNKFTSTIQAILAFTSGSLIARNTHHDVVNASYWITNTYAMFCLSYFAYDTFSMFHGYLLKNHCIKTSIVKKSSLFVKSNFLMFLHHVVIIFGIVPYLLWRRGKGDFIFGCFYMMEFSLPFIHFRYLLLKLQMANSLLYTINGVFILVTFFIFRILVFPFMYNMYAVHRNLPSITAAVTAVPFLCNVLTFVCFLPQAYWFYVTCRKILSSLLKGNNYEKEEQKTKLM